MDHINYLQQFDKNSIMYYFSENDIVKINNTTVLYRIPYSKGTKWTTFKYGYIGKNINRPSLHIKIISKIVDLESNEINQKKEENIWHSINPTRSKSFLYFQVTFPSLETLQTGIRILLIGTISPKMINQNIRLSN
jgi:hypothetical protein